MFEVIYPIIGIVVAITFLQDGITDSRTPLLLRGVMVFIIIGGWPIFLLMILIKKIFER
jgi:hypothetical protein